MASPEPPGYTVNSVNRFNRKLAAAWSPQRSGFSLTEVVLALGIFSFVVVLLVGLLSSGIQAGKESADKVQAAHLASLLLTKRRICPVDNPSGQNQLPNNFGLPALDTAASDSTPIGSDGLTTGPADAVYLLTYKITPSSHAKKVAQVHLTLSWPANAALAVNSDNRYEISTQIALP